MQVMELMTEQVMTVRPEETVDVAARLLSRGNVGALPVVDEHEAVVGMVTDRDLVVRCIALGQNPTETLISSVMTLGPLTARPKEDAQMLADKMGKLQVRRVPVVEQGRLRGIVSLSDLARRDGSGAAEALRNISRNISRR